MSTINLADAKVSYEGQSLPATHLLGKLQTQLQEVACRLATISSTLGDLQAALLNSETIEVKLTLSREDAGRLRSLEGVDDGERIRRAVMSLIRPEGAEPARAADESRPAAAAGDSRPAAPQGYEIRPLVTTAGEQAPRHQSQPIAGDAPTPKRLTTTCPTCQSPMDIPEMLNNQSSMEVRCENCGAKSLVKSITGGAAKNDRTGFTSVDDAGYKKLFDTLSR